MRAQVVDVAPEPLVDDELDDARDAFVGGERGGADVLVEELDGEALVVHGTGGVNVARLAEEAGCRVDGYVDQQRGLDGVRDVVLDVGVGRVGVAVDRGLEWGYELDVWGRQRGKGLGGVPLTRREQLGILYRPRNRDWHQLWTCPGRSPRSCHAAGMALPRAERRRTPPREIDPARCGWVCPEHGNRLMDILRVRGAAVLAGQHTRGEISPRSAPVVRDRGRRSRGLARGLGGGPTRRNVVSGSATPGGRSRGCGSQGQKRQSRALGANAPVCSGRGW